jgi:predicted metal-dependent hydrolase
MDANRQETDRATAAEIVRRDIRFDLDGCDMGAWHPAGRHVTHFFNALSTFFPEGETFFIDSVLHFKDRVHSPRLAAEVKAFTGQEGMHSREHRRYNRALTRAGLPVQELEDHVAQHLGTVRERLSPEEALGVTIALEHFTAIMADALLSDDRVLEGADRRLAAVWRWHAIEETEHKAVAFDVFAEAVGTGARAYFTRAQTMIGATVIFWFLVFRYHLALVRAEGVAGDLHGWWRLFRFLWISPGGMRKIVRPWLGYFRRDFHPWQHDNLGHVERWKAAYAATGLAPA